MSFTSEPCEHVRFGGELPAPVDELMKLQLMPPAVFGLAQLAGLPRGDVGFPELALLVKLLLTNVGFLCHGSSCDGEIDLQLSHRTMPRRARPVKMGLI